MHPPPDNMAAPDWVWLYANNYVKKWAVTLRLKAEKELVPRLSLNSPCLLAKRVW